MNTFFDQLAAQSGLRIEETKLAPREASVASNLPAADIEIVEWTEPISPSEAPLGLESRETDLAVDTPSAGVAPAVPAENTRADTLPGETPEGFAPQTPRPVADPSLVEPEQPSKSDAPKPLEATPPPEDPVQASLQAVWRWIAAGESSAPTGAPSVEAAPARPGKWDDENAQTVHVDPAHESAPSAAEAGSLEQLNSTSVDSAAPVVPPPPPRIEARPLAAPREETIDRTAPSRAPAVTIGSVQITVDTSPPTPEPSPRRAHSQNRAANPSPQPSRSTYLRRHYIIPH